MRIGRFEAFLLLSGPVLFITLFFVIPLLVMGVASFQTKAGVFTGAQYAKVAFDTYYWRVLGDTFEIAIWNMAIVFVLGYAIAYYLTFYVRSRLWRRLIYVMLVTPLFTSNIVRTFGWIVLLGRKGIVNEGLLAAGIINAPLQLIFSKVGVIISLAYILLPFMVLIVGSVLQNMNRSLLDAAHDLGARPIVAFLKVTFPLSLPGVIAGSLIVFTLSVSAYVTPSIMSGGRLNVMAMLIFDQYMVIFDYNLGATLAIMLLAMTLLIMGVYVLVLERRARMTA
ncbi:MAG: ABC transporter permease [Rhodospirillales bacterium]|nr:ABC transporter permease [Rhodospirillales bacterium]